MADDAVVLQQARDIRFAPRGNNRWVEQIDELLDDNDDYLIIVGALHLIGDAGVPAQLSRAGYPVRQLSEPTNVR